jgi:hypothetical protein
VLEEDYELSRHDTEPRLQICSHSSASLSILFAQFELSRREELAGALAFDDEADGLDTELYVCIGQCHADREPLV